MDCPVIGNALKKEDQVVYAKKLISQGRWYVLTSMLGDLQYGDAPFSPETLDQEIYDVISSNGFYPSPTSFKNLNESTFNTLLERSPDLIRRHPLTITGFEFSKDSELDKYGKYKEFITEANNLFNLQINKRDLEEFYFNIGLDFETLSLSSLEEGLEKVRRKAKLFKKIESVASRQGYETEQILETFNPMLNDLHVDSLTEEMIDELQYVPRSLHSRPKRCLDILTRMVGLDRDKKTRTAMDISMIAGSTSLGDHDLIYQRYFDLSSSGEVPPFPIHEDVPAPNWVVPQIPEFCMEYKEMSEHSQALWQRLFPWSESLKELEGIQKQARRKEYDPWRTDLVPLLTHELGTVSFSNPEDGKIVVDYVKRFGMKNIPYLFSVFFQVHKSKDVDQIPPHIKGILLDDFGINAEELCKKDKKNIGLIFSEMEKMQAKLFGDIRNEDLSLLDRLEKSPYLLETLKSAIGNSGHAHGVTTEEALKIYKKSVKESPKKFELAEGYNEVEISVPEVVFAEGEKLEAIQKEKEKVFSNGDLKTLLDGYRDAYEQIEKPEYVEGLATKKIEIRDFIRQSVNDLRIRLEQEEAKEIKNEKAIFGLNLRLKQFEEKLREFDGKFENALKIETSQKERIETIFDLIPDDYQGKKKLMLELSLSDIRNKMPQGYELLRSGIQNEDKSVALAQIHEFIANHVKEHYLNRKHGQDEAIETDTKAIVKALKHYWNVQDFDNSILAVSHIRLEELNKGTISNNELTLNLVPSKGLQRIFSGDLGGACTSRENGNLAKGEFQGITSYSIVLDKGTKNEKFAGSFLVIETKTEDGEPVLVLRANNPHQNLFNMVDGDSLIQSIVNEVKALAKRRGVDKVVAPLSGGATSNRTQVPEYYDKMFSKNKKVGLKKTPETNFNGYNIWNEESENAVTIL